MTGEAEMSMERDSLTGSLPSELMRFIQRDTYSLLIKGYAGTGKTTLALTILRALGARENFFFISTRISPKELFSYYPWLASFTENEGDNDGREALHDRAAMPSFEDARLDEPESLFERITNQLMDIKSPIIIIDSWDAIAAFMDKEGRMNNERVLQTWRERAGAKLIFISEDPEDSTLDFLVGGVVELRQRQYENARLREILLLKLRGVRIDRPSYVFTLEKSTFRSFEPFAPPALLGKSATGRWSGKSSRTFSSNQIRTGYDALDSAIGGGFPRNGIVLMEHDERLNTSSAISILSVLVSNLVRQGNPVIIQTFGKLEPGEIMQILRPALPPGKEDLAKILWSRKYPSLPDNVVLHPHRQVSSAVVASLRKRYPGALVLSVTVGDDSSEEISSVPKRRMEITPPSTSDLSIALVNSSRKQQIEHISAVATVHLRLVLINDTLFLKPVMPASALYAIGFAADVPYLEALV